MIIYLWFLNLLDALSTHLALSQGIAEELNPIMAWAYDVSPMFFATLKVFIGSLICLGLYSIRHLRRGQVFATVLAGAYTGLILWHGVMWVVVWRRGLL